MENGFSSQISLASLWRRLKQIYLKARTSLPNRCLLCQQRIIQYGPSPWCIKQPVTGVCETCLSASLYQTEVCLSCAYPLTSLQAYCGQCLKSISKTPPLKVIAPCSYHEGLGHVVSAIKYQKQLAGLQVLCEHLAYRINTLIEANIITRPQVLLPVPLHINRLQKRQFNQAWLIADRLSRLLDIPVDARSLSRIKDTSHQAGLDGHARRLNCLDAFSFNCEMQYHQVAIIDDVYTTGATTKAINKLLRQHNIGAQVWCLARAEAPIIKQLKG